MILRELFSMKVNREILIQLLWRLWGREIELLILKNIVYSHIFYIFSTILFPVISKIFNKNRVLSWWTDPLNRFIFHLWRCRLLFLYGHFSEISVYRVLHSKAMILSSVVWWTEYYTEESIQNMNCQKCIDKYTHRHVRGFMHTFLSEFVRFFLTAFFR